MDRTRLMRVEERKLSSRKVCLVGTSRPHRALTKTNPFNKCCHLNIIEKMVHHLLNRKELKIRIHLAQEEFSQWVVPTITMI
jgi:hypothetical protein